MKHVSVVSHPLIDHSLTVLRDKTTDTETFRRHSAVVSKILLVHALETLRVQTKHIETPLSPMKGKTLKDQVIVVPVLRAGLAMLFAVQDFLPFAGVGFVGLERDEKTAIAREYYKKLPSILATHKVIVLDPMLATGGSFDDTVHLLKQKGTSPPMIVCIVSAPEGLKRIIRKHPDVRIITAAIDDHLNEKKYIVPGLGDFGDRYFGT